MLLVGGAHNMPKILEYFYLFMIIWIRPRCVCLRGARTSSSATADVILRPRVLIN